MEKNLPIGSVVVLTGGEKRLMVYGHAQQSVDSGQMWDYIACPYPEGNISAEFTYLFNQDQIERVFFIGMQDEEGIAFQEQLAQRMSEPATT